MEKPILPNVSHYKEYNCGHQRPSEWVTLLVSVNLTAAVNQCVTPVASSSVDHKPLSIKHSRYQRMWECFPFPSLPSIQSTVCDLYGHSTLCPPVSPNPPLHCRRGVAGVSAISDPHWKWQVNFAQLLPFSVPLSSDASVPSHSVTARL